jgi:hypothetical protein
MKLALESMKKGLRHPAAKLKPSNITTPGAYEAAEIQKYIKDIKIIEDKFRDKKAKEEI